MSQTSEPQPDNLSHLSHLMIIGLDETARLAPILTPNDTSTGPGSAKILRRNPVLNKPEIHSRRGITTIPGGTVRQNAAQTGSEPVRFSKGGLVIIPRDPEIVLDMGHNPEKPVFIPKRLSRFTTCMLDGCLGTLQTRRDHWVVDYTSFKWHFDRNHAAGTVVEGCEPVVGKGLWKCPHEGCSVVVDEPGRLCLHLFTVHMNCWQP